jgi:hypothetical protein
MTDQLFSDPVHVEPVRAPEGQPSSDPFRSAPSAPDDEAEDWEDADGPETQQPPSSFPPAARRR